MENQVKDVLAIVLAAGKGTRMKSDLPKVLYPVLGRPMIAWVLDALTAVPVGRTAVVVGYQADRVKAALAGRPDLVFAEQRAQLGTGHAVQMCGEYLRRHEGPVVIVTGDSPCLQPESVRQLLDAFVKRRLACLLGTLETPSPEGLGRIVRDGAGRFVRIVEEKDASPQEREIREVNMSTYVFDPRALEHALAGLRCDNRQHEYYLTDCPEILLKEGYRVDALPVLQPCEALSVNRVEDVGPVEAALRAQHAALGGDGTTR